MCKTFGQILKIFQAQKSWSGFLFFFADVTLENLEIGAFYEAAIEVNSFGRLGKREVFSFRTGNFKPLFNVLYLLTVQVKFLISAKSTQNSFAFDQSISGTHLAWDPFVSFRKQAKATEEAGMEIGYVRSELLDALLEAEGAAGQKALSRRVSLTSAQMRSRSTRIEDLKPGFSYTVKLGLITVNGSENSTEMITQAATGG